MEILYHTNILDVVKEGERIHGVVISNKSGLSFVRGKYFADTTGDADICAFAGCPYLVGAESGGVAAASLELHVDQVDHEV